MNKLPIAEGSPELPNGAAPGNTANAPGAVESAQTRTASDASAAARVTKKKHKARIEHKVPGRMRIKIPSAKGNPGILEVFESVFSAIPGITKVKPKPETGSIVIHYDPKREAEFQTHFHSCCAQHEMSVASARPGDEIEEIAKKIEAEASFLAERSELVRATVDLFKNVDYQIKAVTDNTIDLKIVLVGGLAVATFVEIGAEAATPMWVTLALFAMNHFIELKHEPQPARIAATSRQAAER